MEKFDPEDLRKLYLPSKDSHKGQNGKLTIVGGSHLFHGASLWALKVASRICDMVFYSSISENNELTQKLKSEIFDFIAVPRGEVENYIEESDAVLIGPGMVRTEEKLGKTDYQIKSLKELDEIEHEGIQTYYLTEYLLNKYPQKKWVIDAGSLQMMEPEWLKGLNGNAIITPHHRELEQLFNLKSQISRQRRGSPKAANLKSTSQILNLEELVTQKAKKYNCVILLKGPADIVCSPQECQIVEGGNEGMTKGGTGDVLAGLAAALACKNDLFLAACAASYINKKAGEELYKRVGPYFNASDLCDEIPKVMGKLAL